VNGRAWQPLPVGHDVDEKLPPLGPSPQSNLRLAFEAGTLDLAAEPLLLSVGPRLARVSRPCVRMASSSARSRGVGKKRRPRRRDRDGALFWFFIFLAEQAFTLSEFGLHLRSPDSVSVHFYTPERVSLRELWVLRDLLCGHNRRRAHACSLQLPSRFLVVPACRPARDDNVDVVFVAFARADRGEARVSLKVFAAERGRDIPTPRRS
jgi:hypothetical protein